VTRLARKVVAPTVGSSAATNGNVLFRTPVDWILSGYTFDWVPDAFYVHAFGKALFVPSSNLLGVSKRLHTPGGSMRWPPRWRPPESSDDQLVAAMSTAIDGASPFVDSISSIDGFVAYVENRVDPDRLNPLFQEQVVYGRTSTDWTRTAMSRTGRAPRQVDPIDDVGVQCAQALGGCRAG
jgi:hypothetical protein